MGMKGKYMMDIFFLILYSFMAEEVGKCLGFLEKLKQKNNIFINMTESAFADTVIEFSLHSYPDLTLNFSREFKIVTNEWRNFLLSRLR